jgi:CheY-like chemotaxis protein/HPt (histidine-containing phosphotransfer) domain-containing protein
LPYIVGDKKIETTSNAAVHDSKTPSFKQITVPSKILTLTKKLSNKDDQPHILLVEDNEVGLHIIESIANQAGCNFISATDGEQAFKFTQSIDFDLIISDVGLPGISGHELARIIRNWEISHHKKNVPIVGLTAHARGLAKDECLQAGMNDVFTKPINLEIMQKILKKFLSFDISKDNNSSNKNPSQAPGKLGHDLPDTEAKLFELTSFPLLDIKNASESMGGESMLREILLLMVKQEIPRDIEAIEKAYSERNWNEIESIAHKMKGGTVYCGTVRMQYACQYLERYQKAGYSTMLKRLYHQLIDVTRETKLAVEQWLDKTE